MVLSLVCLRNVAPAPADSGVTRPPTKHKTDDGTLQIGTSLETFLEKRARVDVLQRERLISEVLLYVQEKTTTARRASAFVVVENRTCWDFTNGRDGDVRASEKVEPVGRSRELGHFSSCQTGLWGGETDFLLIAGTFKVDKLKKKKKEKFGLYYFFIHHFYNLKLACCVNTLQDQSVRSSYE